MDRWSGREDDDVVKPGPQGKVARLGIGAFVKQDAGPIKDEVVSTGSGKIEVVASRRQQKEARAAAAMPPPPVKMAAPVSASVSAPASHIATPAWAGTPPQGYFLEVQKNGEPVQQVELLSACTLFGRGANAHVVLDHASISRQHAVVCYRPDGGKWLVVDQGSAHGTFINGKPISKGVPTQLTMQVDKLSFGASTRMYVLKQQAKKEGGHLKRHAEEVAQQPVKKGRFAGEQAELDRVERPVRGQFADVIKSELRPAASPANPGNSTSVKAEQHAPARTKPEYQKFVASHLKRPPAFGQGSLLYDALPPEKQKATML